MKAIKVFIDREEQFRMLCLVEKLNGHPDIMATATGPTEFVVAAEGEYSMAYTRAVIEGRLNDCTIEIIK